MITNNVSRKCFLKGNSIAFFQYEFLNTYTLLS